MVLKQLVQERITSDILLLPTLLGDPSMLHDLFTSGSLDMNTVRDLSHGALTDICKKCQIPYSGKSKVCRHCFLNKIQLIKQTILINQSLFGSSRNLQKKHIGLCRGEHLIQLWLFFLRVLVMHFLTYILWCRAKSTEIFYPLTQYVNGIIHFTCTRFQRTY